MKLRFLISLLLFYLVPAIAQIDIKPESKLNLPSDTSWSIRQTIKKSAPYPELNLPDVSIIKDRYQRHLSNKITRANSPTLLQPGSPYDPISKWFTGEMEKPHVYSDTSKTRRRIWGRLWGGNHTRLLLNGGYWQQYDPKTSFQINTELDRSSGQYTNSQYCNFMLSGKGEYQINPYLGAKTELAISNDQYGLHRYAFSNPQTERYASNIDLSTHLSFKPFSASEGVAGIEYKGLSLKSDTGLTNLNTSDAVFNLFFDYTFHFKLFQISVSGQHLKESLNIPDTTRNLFFDEFNIALFYPVSRLVTASAGIAYQSVKADSQYNQHRFSPYGRFNFMLSNKLGLTTFISSGYEMQTFSERWGNNRYIAHNVPIIPDKKQFGIKLQSDFMITPALKLYLIFKRDWFRTFLVYLSGVNDDNLLNMMVIEDVRLSESGIGATWQYNDWIRFQASFTSYSELLKHDAPSLGKLPYRPEFHLPLRCSVQLEPGILIDLTSEINGKRAVNRVQTKKLPAYALLHLEAKKNLTKQIVAELAIYNILNTSYKTWAPFKEPGIQIMTGLVAKF